MDSVFMCVCIYVCVYLGNCACVWCEVLLNWQRVHSLTCQSSLDELECLLEKNHVGKAQMGGASASNIFHWLTRWLFASRLIPCGRNAMVPTSEELGKALAGGRVCFWFHEDPALQRTRSLCFKHDNCDAYCIFCNYCLFVLWVLQFFLKMSACLSWAKGNKKSCFNSCICSF